ncbi:MAG: hypothetical protein PHE15_00935 [Dehalococcoidales bacterium]|nr:hypothetical protein [Dehalococcoidales bacterium]
MNKKMKITLGVILAAGLLAIPLVSTAMAAGPANNSGTCSNCNSIQQLESRCGSYGIGYNSSSDVCETICELLGITQDELQSLRFEGLSLVEKRWM